MADSIAWIPGVLLLGAAVNGLLTLCSAHRGGPKKGMVIPFALGAPWIAFALSVMAFFKVKGGEVLSTSLYQWFDGTLFTVDVAFQMDSLSAVMILVVTGVGALIHTYAVGYMSKDPGFGRFFSYLNLFTFFMSILVLGSSPLLLFVGWEGVGLCSYLLIGFWWKDGAKAQAGSKAFIVNRIGDVGFVLGVLLIISTVAASGKSVHDFASLEAFATGDGKAALESPFIGSFSVVEVAGFLLRLGAFGKSAQLPLYVWLPDAMAGPTPVSALIHAATMVTAGVYMVARLHFLFVMAPTAMAFVAIVGALTALFAATIGIAQNDIKQVLAYSTVSQLGFMFAAVGVGAFSVGIFHVVTHAFFKALLFLGAGSVIHGPHEEQDMRKMGGLIKIMPITGWTMIIGSLALSGVPPFSGFFSKDEILASTLHPHPAFPGGIGPILYVILTIASLCTAFYTFRMVWLTFFGESRVDPEVRKKAHESPAIMTLPLVILAVGAAAIGFLGVPHALGGHNVFGSFVRQTVTSEVEAAHEGSGALLLVGIAVAIAILGVLTSYWFYRVRPSIPGRLFAGLGGFGRLVASAYRVDALYAKTIVNPLTRSAKRIFYEVIDVRFVDGLVNFFGSFTKGLAGLMRLFQTGAVRTYVFFMMIGAILLVWSVFSWS